MKISIIAAIGKNRELGKSGKIPWHISEDFKRFKNITSGYPVIMGRKTWESLPIKPLPGRYNIVITGDINYKVENENIKVVSSLGEAIKFGKELEKEEVFVIGGGQIYQQAISLADKLYLTVIDRNFDADTFFPDYSDFKKVVFEKESQEREYNYKFLELEK